MITDVSTPELRLVFFRIFASCWLCIPIVGSAASLQRIDDAAHVPFSDVERQQYSIDPDRAYQVAQQVIDSPVSHETEAAFLQRLKDKLSDEFPFINRHAPTLTNRYHHVTGKIEVLYATPWEYMILYKFERAEAQESRWAHFSKNFSNRAQPDAAGLGYSGTYAAVFRTIPVWGSQITITQDGTRHEHRPGDRSFLPVGNSKFYTCGWILECAHGSLWPAVLRVLWENKSPDIAGQVGAMVRGLRHRIALRLGGK